MKHIEENILFSLIDESIEDSKREAHETHIAECDACFSNYSSLKSSYMELTSEELDPVPSELYDRVEAELGLIEDEPLKEPVPNIFNQLIENIQNKLNDLLVPVLAPVTALLLIVFALFRVYSPAIVRVADADTEVDSTISEPYEDDVKFENLAEQEDVKSNLTIDMQDQKQDMGNVVLGEPEEKTPEITMPIDLSEPQEPEYEELDVLVAYWDPPDSDMETRSIPRPVRIPDLRGKSLEQIQKALKDNGIKHIIYKSRVFKQSVEPNGFLKSTDTLKVFFPLPR